MTAWLSSETAARWKTEEEKCFSSMFACLSLHFRTWQPYSWQELEHPRVYSSALNSTSTHFFLSRNHGTMPKMTFSPGKKFLHFKESTPVTELWMKSLDSPLKQPRNNQVDWQGVKFSGRQQHPLQNPVKDVRSYWHLIPEWDRGQLTSPTVFRANNQREVLKETALLSKTTILLSLLGFAHLLTISLFSAKPEQEANRRGRDTVKPNRAIDQMNNKVSLTKNIVQAF